MESKTDMETTTEDGVIENIETDEIVVRVKDDETFPTHREEADAFGFGR